MIDSPNQICSASGCPLASKAKGRYEPTSSLNGGGRSSGSSTFSPGRLGGGYDVSLMSGDEMGGEGNSAAKKMKSSLSDIGSVDNGEFSPDEKVPETRPKVVAVYDHEL